MENAIRARRAHFFLTFLLKIGSWAVLEASWIHLGPSWQKFWAVLGPQDASKMRYLGSKTAPRRDQDLPKSGPKHFRRRTWQPKTAKNLKNLENESQKSMGYPSGPLFFAAYMGTFGTILVRILEDFLYFILDRCCTFSCF